MFNRLKISIGVLLAAFSLVFMPAAASAFNPLSQACGGVSSATCSQASGQGTTNPVAGPKGIINTAAGIIAVVTGVVAVIIIMISGFMFITAGGDANKAKTARSALLGAVIGLVIIAFAWGIVTLVTKYFIQ